MDGYIHGKIRPFKATLYAINNGDTLTKQIVTLPAHVLVDPNAEYYNIVADSARAFFTLSSEESGINITGKRTADSAKVVVQSKRKLHFWYSIYLDDKLIKRGEADSLNYKKAIRSKGNITVFAYYTWAGKLQNTRQTFADYDKSLKIDVQQPLTIYPGQKVTTELMITDSKGKPVDNADVTAWSLTSKFENYTAPSVPYFGSFGKMPSIKNLYKNQSLNDTQNLLLNWKRWSRHMGLDSIEYYRFTHPDTIYTITENIPDTVTQIAPFVVHNGDIVPVHIIYIDNIPVYFSQTQDLSRYSFRVDSGMHDIRMRTSKMEIEVKDVIIAHHKKTIFSINADSLLRRFDISIKKMPDTLLRDEKKTLNNYLISIDNTFNMQLAKLRQGERLYLLNPEISGNTRPYVLTGPLSSNYADYGVKGNVEQHFIAETGYNYTFLPGLLKQKSFDGNPYNKELMYGKQVTDYKQLALTPAAADTLWQNYLDKRSQSTNLFQNTYIYRARTPGN